MLNLFKRNKSYQQQQQQQKSTEITTLYLFSFLEHLRSYAIRRTGKHGVSSLKEEKKTLNITN